MRIRRRHLVAEGFISNAATNAGEQCRAGRRTSSGDGFDVAVRHLRCSLRPGRRVGTAAAEAEERAATPTPAAAGFCELHCLASADNEDRRRGSRTHSPQSMEEAALRRNHRHDARPGLRRRRLRRRDGARVRGARRLFEPSSTAVHRRASAESKSGSASRRASSSAGRRRRRSGSASWSRSSARRARCGRRSRRASAPAARRAGSSSTGRSCAASAARARRRRCRSRSLR